MSSKTTETPKTDDIPKGTGVEVDLGSLTPRMIAFNVTSKKFEGFIQGRHDGYSLSVYLQNKEEERRFDEIYAKLSADEQKQVTKRHEVFMDMPREGSHAAWFHWNRKRQEIQAKHPTPVATAPAAYLWNRERQELELISSISKDGSS